jgi:hypothetical protein
METEQVVAQGLENELVPFANLSGRDFWITSNQVDALRRLYDRKIDKGEQTFSGFCTFIAPEIGARANKPATIMMFVNDTWFGIEPDGYTHS